MSKVMEIVEYKLKSNVETASFLESSKVIQKWAEKQRGCSSRKMALGDDGVWVEIMFWDNMENAMNAHNRFMADNGKSEFMQMLDPSTLKMAHRVIQNIESYE